MLKPLKTEHDFTAKYLDCRIHEGSKLPEKKKKRGERRGRKSKAGRRVRKFKITLLPTSSQAVCLDKDLSFFNEMYEYTKIRLQEPFVKNKNGYYHGYSVTKGQPTTSYRLLKGILPHTPKYIMNSQNQIIEYSDWMKYCTYQVSYRATVNAFIDAAKKDKESPFNGNTYEAKICYRLINGLLYVKKFNQMIIIEETLPKGSLESIRITKDPINNTWSAVIEILEPYDKVEDVKEGRNGYLETDTKSYKMEVTHKVEKVLESKMSFFSDMSYQVLNQGHRHSSFQTKVKVYQADLVTPTQDIGLLNMACLAAHARARRHVGKKGPFKVPKNYIALSEGFYFQGDILHITRWGISIKLKSSPRLCKRWLDYIVIKKDQQGNWSVAGKKQKKYIFRNISRIFKEFSWKDSSPF